ncbi:hypothetical protein RSAG8_05688, partial [Rhizoctonia solani AG-8 WAC10335]
MLFTPLLALATYDSAAQAGATASTSTSVASSVTPSPASISDAPLPSPTVACASDGPNDSLQDQYQSGTPESERGTAGASILGSQKFRSNARVRILWLRLRRIVGLPRMSSGRLRCLIEFVQDGGWARQQNDHDMPLATAMAGVNMRLTAGGICEMHWHTAEVRLVRILTCNPTSNIVYGMYSGVMSWMELPCK